MFVFLGERWGVESALTKKSEAKCICAEPSWKKGAGELQKTNYLPKTILRSPNHISYKTRTLNQSVHTTLPRYPKHISCTQQALLTRPPTRVPKPFRQWRHSQPARSQPFLIVFHRNLVADLDLLKPKLAKGLFPNIFEKGLKSRAKWSFCG